MHYRPYRCVHMCLYNIESRVWVLSMDVLRPWVIPALHPLPLKSNTQTLCSCLRSLYIHGSRFNHPSTICVIPEPLNWSRTSGFKYEIFPSIVSTECPSGGLGHPWWRTVGARFLGALWHAQSTGHSSAWQAPTSQTRGPARLCLFAFWVEPGAETQIPGQESDGRANPKLSPTTPSPKPTPPG